VAKLKLQPYLPNEIEALGETVSFCEDDARRRALVEAGSDPWSIYTEPGLRILLLRNRAKPFLTDALCKVHEIKLGMPLVTTVTDEGPSCSPFLNRRLISSLRSNVFGVDPPCVAVHGLNFLPNDWRRRTIIADSTLIYVQAIALV
jgi:hypothetical protein